MRTVEIAYLGVGSSAAPLPTIVGVDVHPNTPTIHVGWGDRVTDAPLVVYTDPDVNGICVEIKDVTKVWHQLRSGERYETEARPDWIASVERAAVEIRQAAQESEKTREDVRASCEDYRAIVRRFEAETEQHYARWKTSAKQIARKFRRKRVLLGEQTVPGLSCVRSTRNNLLGYAHIWNGVWQGTIQWL